MNRKQAILAIDDTPVNLRTLGVALANDYDLQIATSGAQGLALAAKKPPDLILLDVMMPEMDGYEVCRRLRADPHLANIPVMFITALAENEAETAGLELGAADYLTKPINVAIAQLRIRNILERESLRRQVELHRDQLEEQVKERTLSLSAAKEAAEAGYRAKTTLLRNMSHELRTPLNGILGMVTLAKRRAVDAKQSDQLTKAETQAGHLLGMVNNLLELAHMDAGTILLARTPFRFHEVLESVMMAATPVAIAKRVELVLAIDSDTAVSNDIALIGDPLRLQIVCAELVANAIKFSDQGKVSLKVAQSSCNSGSVKLRVEVADEGIGIAIENLSSVFNVFEQADGSDTRRHGGNGIGLFLCRELLRLMGGEIGVESQLGHGSTFWFEVELPQATGDAGNDLGQRGSVESQLRDQYSGVAVLVVDGEEEVRANIRESLEPCGLVVYEAASGAEAMEMIQQAGFRLVLADVRLGDMSGSDLAYAIRANPKCARIPILVLTDRSFVEDRDECLRAGMNAHVSKPIIPDLLQSIVLDWLGDSPNGQ